MDPPSAHNAGLDNPVTVGMKGHACDRLFVLLLLCLSFESIVNHIEVQDLGLQGLEGERRF